MGKNKIDIEDEKISKIFKERKLSGKEKEVILKLGIVPTLKNFKRLNEEQMYKFNESMLKIYSKKNELKDYNSFKFSEPGSEKNDVKRFKNLKEWDIEQWNFQKDYNTDLGTEYKNLYMNGYWFRIIAKRLNFLKKEEMIYGQLSSATSYITIEIIEKLNDYLDKIIPNERYIPYKEEMFKKEENSKYYTMTESIIKAGGKEKEYEELYKKIHSVDIYKEIEKISDFKMTNFKNNSFRKLADKKEDIDFFLIGGMEAAENITFRNFMESFMDKTEPFGIIENIIEEILNKMKEKIFNKKEIRFDLPIYSVTNEIKVTPIIDYKTTGVNETLKTTGIEKTMNVSNDNSMNKKNDINKKFRKKN